METILIVIGTVLVLTLLTLGAISIARNRMLRFLRNAEQNLIQQRIKTHEQRLRDHELR